MRLALWLLPLVHARSLSVTLPDATYVGFHNTTSGLDVWLGVRYAAPPVGESRWKAAQGVQPGNATVSATTMPVQCVQSQVGPSSVPRLLFKLVPG
jgi:hypothetical protein